MKAQAFIGRVTEVRPHPEMPGLDVVTISGKTNVANREPADSDAETFPRYEVGDYAVMLTENMLLPEWLLKRLDLWDHIKGKGHCSGKLGNRLRSRRIPNKDGGIVSEVALLPIKWNLEPAQEIREGYKAQRMRIIADEDSWNGSGGLYVQVIKEGGPDVTPEGMDVAGMLGIEEIWEPQT